MSDEDERLTMRRYLQLKMLEKGHDIFTSIEAVSSTAIEHPEWDLDELRTWEEWEKT